MSTNRIAKKILTLLVALCMVTSSVMAAMADSMSDQEYALYSLVTFNNKVTKKDLENARNERDRARQRASSARTRLNNLKNQKTNLEGELSKLNQMSAEQREQYELIAGQLASALEAREAALNRYIEAQEVLEEKQEQFEKRVGAMFEFQNKSELELMLESDSVAGFFTNMELMSLIADADSQAIDELQVAVDDAQLTVDNAMVEAGELQEIADAKQNELNELESKIGQTSSALDNVSTKITSEEKILDAVNAESAKLDRELSRMQSQYNSQSSSSTSGSSSSSSSGSSSSGNKTNTVSGIKFSWPTASHKVTSPFGYRIHPISGVRKLHTGIDIGGCGYGATISSAADGKVIRVVTPVPGRNTGGSGYGNYVIVDHGNGCTTLYAHCKTVNVKVGQTVSRGQKIATVGSTGSSTGAHLHFEVRIGGTQKNPLNYLP